MYARTHARNSLYDPIGNFVVMVICRFRLRFRSQYDRIKLSLNGLAADYNRCYSPLVSGRPCPLACVKNGWLTFEEVAGEEGGRK